MRSKVLPTAILLATQALALSACDSSGSSVAETPMASASLSASASPSATTSMPAGGQPSRKREGPDSRGMSKIKAVNLNTNGVSPGGANVTQVATAARAFLKSLDDKLRGQVEYDFSDSQARRTWSYLPVAEAQRKGIVLADLTAYQQTAALAILQFALSGEGLQQDTNIGKADDYLAGLGGKDADGFGTFADYSIAIYGTPSESTPFMIQFGGHHLARNLTYNGDRVSQTPQFVGSEPTSFPADGTTVEPVRTEATGMFGVMSGLTPDQRAAAQITSGTFDDLLMGPGKDTGAFPAAEGLPVSQLDETQKQAVMAAIQAYAGDLAPDAAARLVAKYRAELDQTRIGWSNNTGPTDENSYIRIDGPSVWIEFINTRSQSTPDIHFHSVYRDKTDDYGSSRPS